MSGDLGHPLQFGIALTASATDPTVAVALAQRAEDAGLDLIAIRDDALAFDPWTLAAWIAARTSRIGLRVDDLDVDERPASVLAGAAATLDLLSGGRVEITLTSRTHDAAVLADADEVIRELWDVRTDEPASTSGEHHHVAGAARGPAPRREVAIWMTGTTASEVALAGRTADGWTEIATGPDGSDHHEALDSAAREVGRDPRELRRAVILDAGALEVDEALARAIADGVSTFLLSTADAAEMKHFAESFAPAVRLQVADARRAAGTPVASFRRAEVRAARRPGITYDTLPNVLARTAVEPGDAGYAAVRSTYMRGGSPGLVLRPRDAEQTAEALAFAGRQDVSLGIRSGGHGISGHSTNDGGLIVDLGALDQIDVLDADAGLVRVGAGARWGEVAAVLGPYGLAITSGDFGGVGVGGLATAGGIGLFAREHGLTIDRVRAVEVVTTDGRLLRVDSQHHPELFWGMRGAGSALGVATAFEIEAAKVDDVGFARLVFDASDVAGFLQRYSDVVTAAPRLLTAFLAMGGSAPGQPTYGQIYAVVDSPDPDIIVEHLQPLAGVAPLVQQQVVLTPYAGVVTVPGSEGYQSSGEPAARSGFIGPITDDVASDAERFVASGEAYFFQLRSVGGAVADVATDATAYAHRSASFSVVAFGADQRRLDTAWDRVFAPHVDGFYWSFSTDRRPERLVEAFPPATLERLRALKTSYDPQNLLRDNIDLCAGEVG